MENRMKLVQKFSALLLLFLSCAVIVQAQATVTTEPFGRTNDGESVDLYTLRNRHGVEARITNYGGILVSLKVPDRSKRLEDVVLGYDNLSDYTAGNAGYLGALIGRYGNRIARGRFTLNGVEYTLATNNNENHLHAAVKGFDKV